MEGGINVKRKIREGEDRISQGPQKWTRTKDREDVTSIIDGSEFGTNPYLSHRKTLPPLVSGKTTVELAIQYEDSNENFLNGKPYSDTYRDLLKKRRTLPVNKHRDVFLDLIRRNQVVVVVGEAGSGKTTQ